MKITVNLKPVMSFSLTQADLDVLKNRAQGHYDDTCRAALLRARSSNDEGFLTRWQRLTDNRFEIDASFSTLDVALKILEQEAGLSDEQLVVRDALVRAFGKALDHASTLSHRGQSVLDV